MNQYQKKLTGFLGIFAFLIIAISGYLTISDLAGSQSRQHQQSISPVFTLIEKELLKPLQIATTISDLGIYEQYFLAEQPPQDEIVPRLASYKEKFNLEFYIAHDKSRKQYNSDGRVFDLVEGEVIWYFALKDQTDSPVQAVLGKRDDVHLYIDVRQYNEQGEFTGFLGVGKSLRDFLQSFETFKQQYGHEFIFVNNNGEIVLSSSKELAPEHTDLDDGRISIKRLQDVSWYDEFVELADDVAEPSEIVKAKNGDLLVSRLSLQSLNWQLFILTPLNERQKEVNQSYTLYIGLGFVVLFVLYKVLYRLIENSVNSLSRRINQDPLTKLANREYARLFFNRMRKRHRQVAVILADLDDFKQVNDQFGHMAGDEVLKAVSTELNKCIGKNDLVIRWGGEEFALILPECGKEDAHKIAENCRKALEKILINYKSKNIYVTASFGYYTSRRYSDSLDLMIEYADKAMYQVKASGKNKVLDFDKKADET